MLIGTNKWKNEILNPSLVVLLLKDTCVCVRAHMWIWVYVCVIFMYVLLLNTYYWPDIVLYEFYGCMFVYVCLCVCVASYYFIIKTQKFNNQPIVTKLLAMEPRFKLSFDFRAHTLSHFIILPADGMPISFFGFEFISSLLDHNSKPLGNYLKPIQWNVGQYLNYIFWSHLVPVRLTR